jgi:hypothetical protein
MKYLITIITTFLLIANPAVAQTYDSTNTVTTTIQSDTTQAITTDPYEGTDDFSPGLALLTLIGVGFIFVCVGAGIVLTVIALLIISGLISFGILSASILIGLNKKSFALGFKTFLVSTSTIGGLLLGGLGFWILNKVLHWWTIQTALTIGAAAGLLAGLTFGLITFYILQQLTTYLRDKLKLTEGENGIK